MRMSLTKTCGPSSSLAASSACRTSRGLVKLRTGRSSRASAFSSTKRMDWSSSTIQMGFMPACEWLHPVGGPLAWLEPVHRLRSWQGDQDSEDRASGLALAFDGAVVLLNEGLGQGEPQARSTFPARHQRVEDPISQGLRDTRAVVLNMQDKCQPVQMAVDCHAPGHARAQGDQRI